MRFGTFYLLAIFTLVGIMLTVTSCSEDIKVYTDLSQHKGSIVVQKGIGNHFAVWVQNKNKEPEMIWVYEIVYNKYAVGDTIK